MFGLPSIPENLSRPLLLSEKASYSDHDNCDGSHIAENVVFTMHNGSMSIEKLRMTLAGSIRETSWWSESLAKRILVLLEMALKAEASMGPAMKEAFTQATESAKHIGELSKEFVKEHPIITGVVCTILALGILYLIAPGVVEILGFTEYGPAAGM